MSSRTQDASFFGQVKVNRELGTVSWPNDADFDSDVLYAKVTVGRFRSTSPRRSDGRH
jgi:hypothetical protein